MQRLGFHQPSVAVNPRAGIPAGTPTLGIETHGNQVFAAESQMRREIHAERRIAVGPGREFVAVDPDLGVGHCAIEIEEHLFAFVLGWEREGLFIPADGFPWQLGGVSPQILAERAFDAPVVRQVELAPSGVNFTLRRHTGPRNLPRSHGHPLAVSQDHFENAGPRLLGQIRGADA